MKTDGLTIAQRREALEVVAAKMKKLRATLPADSPLNSIVWQMEAIGGEIDAALHAAQLREERGES